MKTEPEKALKMLSEVQLNPIHEIPRYKADIIARIAFSEGQSNPKIKQLKWYFYGTYHITETPVGRYVILEGDEKYLKNYITYTLTHNRSLIADYNSIKEALSAAQADFEKRIKECLL